MENERFQDMVLEHMARLTQEITEVKTHIGELNARVIKIETVIENNIARNFEAVFDGQKQMQEQLKRIENKVDQHDEIIFKRIK